MEVRSGLRWVGSSCKIRSQTSLAAYAVQHRQAAGSADQNGRRGVGQGAVREGAGRGLRAADLRVRSGVRGRAAARSSKVHERGGGLRAGPRRRYRRRRGAEADSSGVPGGGGSHSHPEAARPCSPRPRAPGPGRGTPTAASPARARGRCGAGPGACRASRRVYTPDGGFSPIPFSTSSIRSSSITTAQGESASAARPRGAAARKGPGSSPPSATAGGPATTLGSPCYSVLLMLTQATAKPSSHRLFPAPPCGRTPPSSKDSSRSSSQSKPSRHLNSPPSELIWDLLLMRLPLFNPHLTTEPPPQSQSPVCPAFSPTQLTLLQFEPFSQFWYQQLPSPCKQSGQPNPGSPFSLSNRTSLPTRRFFRSVYRFNV